MILWQLLVLAVLQGLTEFLPISSKTHLLFAQSLMGWTDAERNLSVTIVLHAGSLLAILVYYARSWYALLRERASEWLPLFVGTLPAAAVGLLLRERIIALFGAPAAAGGLLIVTGAWLFLAERRGRERIEDVRGLPLWKALLIGIAQAAALLPGISRSGATIGAGYLLGLRRSEAVRFSFFLGAVAIGGALASTLWKTRGDQADLPIVPIGIGVAVTFLVSLAAIRIVEIVSKKGRLAFFAAYCVAVGLGAALYFILGKG